MQGVIKMARAGKPSITEINRLKIIRNYSFLVNNLKIDTEFAAVFNTWTREEIENVMTKNTTASRNRCFLETLERKTGSSYDKFIKALVETGQISILEQVESEISIKL